MTLLASTRKKLTFTKFPIIWLAVFFSGAFFVNYYASLRQYKIVTVIPSVENLKNYSSSQQIFLIKTPGCSIPKLNVIDNNLKQFVEETQIPNCNNGTPPLVGANLTSIYTISSSYKSYKVKTVKFLKCCYKELKRIEPSDIKADNQYKESNNCTQFIGSKVIQEEFIAVYCKYNNSDIYKDYFAFVPVKSEKLNKFPENTLNVLVIGLDAVSRLNFHRQMPKTANYLKNKLSAVELLGYNKVGDNTYPNLIPVLTGSSEDELDKACYKNHGHFDDCPFMWKDFKQDGYVTSFGEDAAWMGIFNYVKLGFKKQPTDYMWGFYEKIAEQKIGNQHFMNVDECIGSRRVYEIFLDYIYKFANKMNSANLPYFAFYWGASLSHDDLNKPKEGDEKYVDFFTSLKDGGYLENTALVFMSDHGIRWGDIRKTYQGRMEERLPFVFIVLPDWFKNKYKQSWTNLLVNTKRLSTPYDLHYTLLDFKSNFSETSVATNQTRGQSLFKEISPHRTCIKAGIAAHWCSCQKGTEISTNDTLVLKLANFTVDHLNSLFSGYADCAKLALDSVSSAQKMEHYEDVENALEQKLNQFEDYILTLQTVPGKAIFEVTVRKHLNVTNAINKSEFEIMGTVSRLNLYKDQSYCVSNFHLKLYCYCETTDWKLW